MSQKQQQQHYLDNIAEWFHIAAAALNVLGIIHDCIRTVILSNSLSLQVNTLIRDIFYSAQEKTSVSSE